MTQNTDRRVEEWSIEPTRAALRGLWPTVKGIPVPPAGLRHRLEAIINLGSPDTTSRLVSAAAQLVAECTDGFGFTEDQVVKAATLVLKDMGALELYRIVRAAATGEYDLQNGVFRITTPPAEFELKLRPPDLDRLQAVHRFFAEDARRESQWLRDAIEAAFVLVAVLLIEQAAGEWQYFRLCEAPARHDAQGRCGRVFIAVPTGRPRRYCSDACRRRAHRSVTKGRR